MLLMKILCKYIINDDVLYNPVNKNRSIKNRQECITENTRNHATPLCPKIRSKLVVWLTNFFHSFFPLSIVMLEREREREREKRER